VAVALGERDAQAWRCSSGGGRWGSSPFIVAEGARGG
jgi:hypothetical protein